VSVQTGAAGAREEEKEEEEAGGAGLYWGGVACSRQAGRPGEQCTGQRAGGGGAEEMRVSMWRSMLRMTRPSSAISLPRVLTCRHTHVHTHTHTHTHTHFSSCNKCVIKILDCILNSNCVINEYKPGI